jgi:DNA segregation ATPase FtsK/SpoIIIE, S-DNA-T family
MIFEVLTTSLMGGLAAKAFLSRSGAGNDSQKLNKIFALTGLNVKDGSETFTAQLVKKRNYEWGSEYRYRIPLGRSFEDYVAKKKVIEAGINTRSSKIDLKTLRRLKLDRDLLTNIKSLPDKKLGDRKEIELSYDGLLSIKVYNSSMPSNVEWNIDILKNNTWSVLIGESRNERIYHDFDERKHLLIAGATGFGKSVIMKSIITSLVLSQPNHVHFSLIDLKGGAAFTRFRDLKQVVNFGTDTQEASEILKTVQKQMNTDYKKVVEDGFEDVKEAGVKGRHFLIIDEAADLAEDKKSMEILTDIVRKGRGAGYYVIYATQYPSSQAIPMQIKRNIPARLCFVLDSSTASVTVLDGAGAESLPEIPGRGIYKQVKQTVLQTPYIDNKTIDDLIKPHKGGPKIETVKPKTREHTAIIEEIGLSES